MSLQLQWTSHQRTLPPHLSVTRQHRSSWSRAYTHQKQVPPGTRLHVVGMLTWRVHSGCPYRFNNRVPQHHTLLTFGPAYCPAFSRVLCPNIPCSYVIGLHISIYHIFSCFHSNLSGVLLSEASHVHLILGHWREVKHVITSYIQFNQPKELL